MEIADTLWRLVIDLGTLAVELLTLALRWGLVLAWLALALWGINWKKVWPVLGQGAWAPLVLLIILCALVWSRLDPVPCSCLGFVTLPTFWWQLVGVALVVGVTFLCGWLQGVMGWQPVELSLEPPAPAAHDTGHAHH